MTFSLAGVRLMNSMKRQKAKKVITLTWIHETKDSLLYVDRADILCGVFVLQSKNLCMPRSYCYPLEQ